MFSVLCIAYLKDARRPYNLMFRSVFEIYFFRSINMIRKAALYKDVWKVFFGPSYFECIGLCVSFFQVKLNKNTTKGNLNNLPEFLPKIEGSWGGVDLSTIFHSLSTHHCEINLSFSPLSLPLSFLCLFFQSLLLTSPSWLKLFSLMSAQTKLNFQLFIKTL